jgi:hypothetical protein
MKNRKQRTKGMLGLCGLVLLLLVSCNNPGDEFIQGKWARGNVHFWDEWNFDQGTYWHIYDNTHDHIEETGAYIVKEYGEDYVLLELYDQKGGIQSIEDRVELKITFDPETDTLRLRRIDYTRVDESTLRDLTTKQAP